MHDAIIKDLNIKKIYKNIIEQNDFYLNLEPIENILEVYQYLSTIKDVQNNNIFEVYIIGKPIKELSSKFNLIKKYFGDRAIKNTIFIKDKTIINLNILIDAKNIIRGINGSSAHCLNHNAQHYPNSMTFQHIRYNTSCSYFTEIECDHPVINNWTDNTYIDIIIKECVKLGLLTNNIDIIPDIKLTICNMTGSKIIKFVKPTMSFTDFKNSIEHFAHLAPHEQKIYVKNDQNIASHQIIESDESMNLHDIGIRNNDNIYVIYKSTVCTHD
ncbi:hypothetical protein [Powai lake megavirus]|uniref:Ubiquitin-like domain-containing protein n=1 Tax=Powai lake megavirus TaxID=1842663 RepID=A0A160EQ11_9VIRU|nr:hypothetical protein QJ849_gp968 [Powai lake megavirus]ANB51130.1 hypothetical protein [Powai lake megavirus]